MISDLRKRPFARLLLIWIAGILLETYCACSGWSLLLLLVPAGFLLTSCLNKRKAQLSYDTRWVWGVIIICLMLPLSIQYTAFHANNERAPAAQKNQFLQWAEQSQQRLLQPFEQLRLTNAEKSVLSTITLGYRAKMPREVRRQFSLTGVAHILSVSGFHVAIVCSTLSLLLFPLALHPLGRWIRYLLTMTLLWAFAAISGLAVASIRAAVMLSLYLTGKQLRYITDKYNTLAAAAFCMLLYNPAYLFDIGFQLSFTAVLAILYLHPCFSKWLAIRNPLLRTPCDWLTVTLAAQIGVTPLCLYYFGQFSTVFLLTNLPLACIASLLIPLTFAWILLPTTLPFAHLLQSAVETLTHTMVQIVDTCSRLPGSALSFRFNLTTTVLAYAALLVFLFYCRRFRPMPDISKNLSPPTRSKNYLV